MIIKNQKTCVYLFFSVKHFSIPFHLFDCTHLFFFSHIKRVMTSEVTPATTTTTSVTKEGYEDLTRMLIESLCEKYKNQHGLYECHCLSCNMKSIMDVMEFKEHVWIGTHGFLCAENKRASCRYCQNANEESKSNKDNESK